MKKHNNLGGFTLLEILIALFIFTILSLIMARALHTVIEAQAGTERRAENLRNLQIALLIFSRDVTQIVNRPVINANGSEAPAFEGTAEQFSFTHAGYAVAGTMLNHSNLQRANYAINQSGFWRKTWSALDQAANSMPSSRLLLDNINSGNFEYLAKDGKFYSKWPMDEQHNQPLPRAVKIEMTISKWGSIKQIYVIPVQANPAQAAATTLPGSSRFSMPPGFSQMPPSLPSRP